MLLTRASIRPGVGIWKILKSHYCEAPFTCILQPTSVFVNSGKTCCPSRSFITVSSSLPADSRSSNPLASRRTLLSDNLPSCLHASKRFMAKGKDKKKDKKTDKPKVILDDEEMEKMIAYEDFKLEVEAIIDELKNDLKLNYNVRLNPYQIESLELVYDGIKVTLADIVTISRKQQELVINLSATPTATKAVMGAIVGSGLNLNPQQDGNIIYIRMPKVTTEHRQALIKSVKAAGQKAKDTLKDRNFQKKFYIKLADLKKLSQDLQNDVTANVNYYVKQKSALIDEIVEQKAQSLQTN